MSDDKQHVTRLIHWGMALLILSLIVLGFYMATMQDHGVYPLHKSLGVIAFVAIFIRVCWRIKHPWESAMKGDKTEKLVHYAHLVILLLLVLMPISGLMLSGFGGYGVALFGMELIPSNFNEAGQAIAFNRTLSDLGYGAHPIIAYVLSALLAAHILAALKHHFIDKDITLKRMLGSQ